MPKKSLFTEIKQLPQTPGIYLFKDKFGIIIYVGKSVNIRNRVKSYFLQQLDQSSKTAKLVKNIASIGTIQTETEIEALLLESNLIKKYQPFYNIQLKDDKNYKFIEIGNANLRHKIGKSQIVKQNQWPYVKTSRRDENPNSLYFGPFPAGQTVNSVLKTLRKAFPWCKYENEEQLQKNKKACFYSHIKRCPGICDEKITLREYWEIIDNLVLLLESKKTTLVHKLARGMKNASHSQRFEDAAIYRNTLHGLEYVLQQFHSPTDYLLNPYLRSDIRNQEIAALCNLIHYPETDFQKFIVEGYDISNISSQATVASRVVFVGGEANKNLYRRYKIRLSKLPDDYAALQEVITRRFENKNQEYRPNVVLVDGGKGQVHAVENIIHNFNPQIIVIGLAKRYETLISRRGDSLKEIPLVEGSPAKNLLRRIRDEAHRFAGNYQHVLHKKLTLNS